MRQDDVPDVSRVERECFSNPWPQSAYRRELRNPANNHYVVLRHRPTDRLPRGGRGDEPRSVARLAAVRPQAGPGHGHSSTRSSASPACGCCSTRRTSPPSACSHGYRGKGLGELLLIDLFDEARCERNAEWLTLEVRVSNDSAQALYHKYGFTRQGAAPPLLQRQRRGRLHHVVAVAAHARVQRALRAACARPRASDLRDELMPRPESSPAARSPR